MKITFLFASTFSIVLLVAHLFLRNRAQWALGTAGIFCICLIAGWLAARQKLGSFPSYATLGLEFLQGYAQTMGKEAPAVFRWSGMATLIFGLLLISLRTILSAAKPARNERWKGIITAVWLALLLFLSWKHGFVRLDEYHVELFAGFVIVLAFALGVLPVQTVRAEIRARACSVVCLAFSFSILMRFFDASPLDYLVFRPYDHLVQNVGILFHPVRTWKELKESQKLQVEMASLPNLSQKVGSATVDVFGNEQSYAILNGWNYAPRPVFQSYAAYSETLMQLNKNFYLSARAPDFILCRLAPIDHRFPMLEDSFLIPMLLNGCDLIEHEKGFLLLKPNQAFSPRMKLVDEGHVQLGGNIDLRSYLETNLWLEVHVLPGWVGKARQWAYKSPELQLTISRGPSKSKATFKAPASMMAAGFWASPLIFRNEDLLAFYQGKSLVRPEAYSISCEPGQESFWNPNVHFKIYQIETGQATAANKVR